MKVEFRKHATTLVATMKEALSTVNGMFPDALWGSPDDILSRGKADAVGVIVFPGSRTRMGKLETRLFDLNSTFNEYGHTAVYVRHRGKIEICLGFDPHRGKLVLFAVTGLADKVEKGHPTEGQIYSEGGLLTYPGSFAAEFELQEEQAAALSNRLKSFEVGQYGTYTTSGVTKPPPYEVSQGNCISFIRSVLASELQVDVHSSLNVLFGSEFPEVQESGLYEFGSKQARFTPLVAQQKLALYSQETESLTPIKIVPKGTLAEYTHLVTDTYQRTTFARILLGGAVSIGGSLISCLAPKQIEWIRGGVTPYFPLARHHYLVGLAYVLLSMRTAIPQCSSSRAWRILYQAINLLSIISFVQYARSGNMGALQMVTFEAGRTIAYLLGTAVWKKLFR